MKLTTMIRIVRTQKSRWTQTTSSNWNYSVLDPIIRFVLLKSARVNTRGAFNRIAKPICLSYFTDINHIHFAVLISFVGTERNDEIHILTTNITSSLNWISIDFLGSSFDFASGQLLLCCWSAYGFDLRERFLVESNDGVDERESTRHDRVGHVFVHIEFLESARDWTTMNESSDEKTFRETTMQRKDHNRFMPSHRLLFFLNVFFYIFNCLWFLFFPSSILRRLHHERHKHKSKTTEKKKMKIKWFLLFCCPHLINWNRRSISKTENVNWFLLLCTFSLAISTIDFGPTRNKKKL